MLKEFRDFVLRGNLVELAVAFVMGAAFTAVVQGFVSGFVTPLVALAAGQSDFSKVTWEISGTTFPIGQFLDPAFALLMTSAVVFFLLVKPYNALQAKLIPASADEPTTRACPECTSEIAIAARRFSGLRLVTATLQPMCNAMASAAHETPDPTPTTNTC